jgi:CDP-diacylglycerol--glycerol-3-phosphate 3-phosphatidyltransferase
VKFLNISKFDIPNILTIGRLLSAPIFIIVFYFNTDLAKIFAGLIFIIAGLTDFLDGYLARHWNAHSILGRILDPIADKLIVVAAIFMLIFHHKIEGWNILAAMAILLREVVISGLRESLSSLRFDLPVSNIAKIKTSLQILSIVFLIFGDVKPFSQLFSNFNYIELIGLQIFWISAILSIYSATEYVQKSIHIVRKII